MTVSTDSFYNMRYEIHAEMEEGEFGSRFPLFLSRFEPAEWNVEELSGLLDELQAIAAHFKARPPEPLQAPMSLWDEVEEGKVKFLYECYKDADARPLLGSLIEMCVKARSSGCPLQME